MSPRKLLLIGIAVCFLMVSGAVAQDDKFGKADTIFIETYQIDAKTWGVNVSLFNDEDIMALSIPLRFKSGNTRVVADSAVYTGGIVEAFRVKQARVDTATQCLTLGLINDVGVSVPPIPPGQGRIATIFVSSLDDVDINNLKVDSTTTPPGNSLQLVTPPSTGIVPALVIKKIDKPKKEKKEKEKKEADQ